MFFDGSSSVVKSIFKPTGVCSNKLISQRMVVITSSKEMSAVNGNLLDMTFAQDDVIIFFPALINYRFLMIFGNQECNKFKPNRLPEYHVF
jgi:hypothetical protein